MREGALPAYKYALTWCPRNEQGGIVEGEPVRLSGMPVIESVYAPARYCESCRVVIVPVPEIETFSDKAGKWLDKTLGSLGDRIDRAAERREEEKAAREREEKRNKDPWEV
jgi:hypothetical protein